MAYSPIEQKYIDSLVDAQFPDPIEPEPEQPMMLADSGQVRTDAPQNFGSITPIPQTRFEKIMERTGMTLEQIGNELDKLGKLNIGGVEIGVRDILPFVGSVEDGKVTGTPAALQAAGRGESLTRGKGWARQLTNDAKLAVLDVATAGVAKPAFNAGKAAVKGAVNATKNLPVGNSIKLIDGTEKVLEKAPKIETKAFKNWFGDSKAVDDTGKPIVVYHARRGDFEAFDPNMSEGKSFGTGTFFSSSPDVAATYNTSSQHSIVPAYLSFQKPMIVDAGGANWNRIGRDAKVYLPEIKQSAKDDELLLSELTGSTPDMTATRTLKEQNTTMRKVFKGEMEYPDDFASTDDIARYARSQGYDGVIIKNVVDHGPAGRFSTDKAYNPSNIYVAFEPTQIKSAISNKGTFDPKNPSILHGAGAATAGATATQQENK